MVPHTASRSFERRQTALRGPAPALVVEHVGKHASGVQIDAAVESVLLVVVHAHVLLVTGRPDPASWLPCSGKAETSTLGPAQAAIPFYMATGAGPSPAGA
jgi:hypothetical protein